MLFFPKGNKTNLGKFIRSNQKTGAWPVIDMMTNKRTTVTQRNNYNRTEKQRLHRVVSSQIAFETSCNTIGDFSELGDRPFHQCEAILVQFQEQYRNMCQLVLCHLKIQLSHLQMLMDLDPNQAAPDL